MYCQQCCSDSLTTCNTTLFTAKRCCSGSVIGADSCACLGQQHCSLPSFLLPLPSLVPSHPPLIPSLPFYLSLLPSRPRGSADRALNVGVMDVIPGKCFETQYAVWCILVHFGNKLVALHESAVFTFDVQKLCRNTVIIFGAPMVTPIMSHCATSDDSSWMLARNIGRSLYSAVYLTRHQEFLSHRT